MFLSRKVTSPNFLKFVLKIALLLLYGGDGRKERWICVSGRQTHGRLRHRPRDEGATGWTVSQSAL